MVKEIQYVKERESLNILTKYIISFPFSSSQDTKTGLMYSAQKCVWDYVLESYAPTPSYMKPQEI
jgi:hypothetical protein